MPCLRAMAETLTPGWSLSIAMASFSSSLKKRLAARRVAPLLDVKAISEKSALALVLAQGRAEG